MSLDSEERQHGQVSLGCQGWNYVDWISPPTEKIFYPTGTRPADMLEVYARVFQTVEVDSTFYAIPPMSTIENWKKRTPPGFRFSLKLPREITHLHRLTKQGYPALAEFCDRICVLEEKLAVVLIQLSPQFAEDQDNLEALKAFLKELPRDLRFSIEFRSRGWMNKRVAELLGEYDIAPTVVEGPWVDPDEMLRHEEETDASFAYVRWMGARDIEQFNRIRRPRDSNIQSWSEVIRKVGRRVGRVFGYFNNHYEGHSPASANKLKFLLGQPIVEASEVENQLSLF